MIRIVDLHKRLGGLEVLRGVDLEVRREEVIALIGSSGVGKSVLLKHVVGLVRPDRGRVLIDGEDITAARGRRLEALRRRFGFLFQGGALFDSLTVFDNVALPLREKTRLSEEEIRHRVISTLREVGLHDVEGKYPAELSGSMKKRVALARAIIMEPEIMLFDEPTTGLDPIIAKAVNALIKDMHRRLRFTGIIVSHDVPEVFELVDRVAMLHEGRIIAVGTPEEIENSEDPIVRQFVRGELEGPIEYR